MQIRPLGPRDLDGAIALSVGAGWNQTADDWAYMLAHGQGYAIDDPADGSLAASTMTLPYDRGFAWISMVLVVRHRQKQGLAGRLMRRAVDDLRAQGLVPVLDATPAGRPVYLKMGFQDAWGITRWTVPALGEDRPAGVRPLAAGDWEAVGEMDRRAFGADRTALLRHLASRLPGAALVHEQGGRINGYVFGRDGRTLPQIGPLVASDELAARALFKAALVQRSYVDVVDRHDLIPHWLQALGGVAERPLTRMVLGRSTAFGEPGLTIAVAGPELG